MAEPPEPNKSAREAHRGSQLPPGDWGRTIIEALDAAGIGFSVCVQEEPGAMVPVFLSQHAAQLLGGAPEDFVGRSALEAVAASEHARLVERMARRHAGNPISNDLETLAQRRDGSSIPVTIDLSPVVVEGRPYLALFTRDVSERSRARAALSASEARFRLLIEAAPDAIWVTQGERLQYCNRAFSEMLGYPDAHSLIGKTLFELMHTDDAQRVRHRIPEIEQLKGRQPTVERRLRRHDGTVAHVEITTMGVEFEGAPSILCYGRDVSERHKMTQQLLQSDRMAAVGAMAAGVAHEINNPLAYVMLNIDLVLRLLRSGQARSTSSMIEKLEEAREGAERVALIVKDLLSFARSDESWGPLNLRDCVDGALRLVRAELSARARVELDWGDLPAVDGNSARFGQVFLNLFINALQAFVAPRPDRNLLHVRAFEDQGFAVVEVSDNGRGIPDHILPRIFEPFFTTKPAGEGTGLGLSICHSIVTSAGGSLTARNRAEGGACFRVAIPSRVR